MEFLLVVFGVLISYQVYLFLFFSSKKFKVIKESISEHTKDCNELNEHIEELKRSFISVSSRDYGDGNLHDNSNYNYKRNEWKNEVRNKHIHNCSSTVCKNAANQPFKYLCKYFDIRKDEETLSEFEEVLNNFSAAEQGKSLLMDEKGSVIKSISESIPSIISFFSEKRLTGKLGFDEVDLSDLYFSEYSFQYVSAGGNSSYKFYIVFNLDNLEKFITYLSEFIKFSKSAAGQRALMTSKLREQIKIRDNYTCKGCGLSTKDEKNLLLEIDHIFPISKGGMTSVSNLQTLCWRCNRSKGSKIIYYKK